MSDDQDSPRTSDPPPSRPATNTEAAIDDVVESAASEVNRTLDAEGVPPRRVTPEDVAPIRWSANSVVDEPTAKVPVERLVKLARDSRQLSIETPSLSPFEVPSRAAKRKAKKDDEEEEEPTRRVSAIAEEPVVVRVPYPGWILGGMALIASVAGGASIAMRIQMTSASTPIAPLEAATELPSASVIPIPLPLADAASPAPP